MQIDTLKKDLLNTLEIIQVKEFPVLLEEILNFFITADKTQQVYAHQITSKLGELEKEGLIYINEEGFVSLSKNITEEIQKRLHLEEFTRSRKNYSQKLLNNLSGISFIRFIGAVGDAPLGRISDNEKINLILVVEKDTKYISKFIIENYLKIRFAFKNFNIYKVIETDNLTWDKMTPETGIKLLNIQSLINKDKAYENLMAANNWIFEIFSNYPLEKVSWGFRVSKNLDKNVSIFVKKLNAFLSPKN